MCSKKFPIKKLGHRNHYNKWYNHVIKINGASSSFQDTELVLPIKAQFCFLNGAYLIGSFWRSFDPSEILFVDWS